MSSAEQRRQTRYRLAHQPTTPVVVVYAGQRLTATAVNDVSSSGISVCLDAAVAVRTTVAIEFQSDGLTLDVNGSVAWCRPHWPSDEQGGDSGHVLGIELYSPMLLLSAFRDALPRDAQTFDEG